MGEKREQPGFQPSHAHFYIGFQFLRRAAAAETEAAVVGGIEAIAEGQVFKAVTRLRIGQPAQSGREVFALRAGGMAAARGVDVIFALKRMERSLPRIVFPLDRASVPAFKRIS